MFRTLALFNPFPTSSRLKAKTQIRSVSPQRTHWWAVGLIAANAVLLLSYILGVNGYAATGYEIKQMQSSLNQLTDQNKKVSLQVSEISSIVQIQTDLSNSSFVPANSSKFLQINQLSER